MPIEEIQVIRIRPQIHAEEAVGPLIDDPWLSLACEGDSGEGCSIEFEDPGFAGAGRDTVYYVRALQAEEPMINAGGLRCELDADGQCHETRACYQDDRTGLDDDCLEPARHRAWSSPIFVDFEPAPADSPGDPTG